MFDNSGIVIEGNECSTDASALALVSQVHDADSGID